MLILSAIYNHKKLYGLEIIKNVKDVVAFEISEGTLYPLLSRLQREELIKGEWIEASLGHPRKYYQLTPKGEEKLQQMLNYWSHFSSKLNEALKNKE